MTEGMGIMKNITVSWRRHLEAFLDAVLGPSAPRENQLELPLWDSPIRPQAHDTASIEPRDPPGGGGLPIPKISGADSGLLAPQDIDRAA